MESPKEPVTDNHELEARRFRKRLGEELQPICTILDEALTRGFAVNFNVSLSPGGRHVVKEINIMRHY